MAPLLLELNFDGPVQAYELLTQRTAVLAIQSGEFGPMAQVIAGIDLALWDLCARRAGQPLWRYLGGTHDHVTAYASGINPERPQDIVAKKLADGYRGFKLKIGFGAERDLANLSALRELLGTEPAMMVDANQGWSLAQARDFAPQLEAFNLSWLEEPLRADRPWSEWQTLAGATAIPLAAGENIVGADGFAAALTQGPLKVLQPDLAKWGGISGCWPVIDQALRAGLRYCPHYLGAGIGLLASAHVLAAAGGNGMLEVDANPNPLRTLLAPSLVMLDEGRARLGERPGLGIEPDLQALAQAIATEC